MGEINLKKLIDDCLTSENTLTVKEVAEITQLSFSLLYNEGSLLKEVEKKIGEKDFNVMVTSIFTTLLTNVYSNSKPKRKRTRKTQTNTVN